MCKGNLRFKFAQMIFLSVVVCCLPLIKWTTPLYVSHMFLLLVDSADSHWKRKSSRNLLDLNVRDRRTEKNAK